MQGRSIFRIDSPAGLVMGTVLPGWILLRCKAAFRFLRGGMAYLEAKVIHQHEMPTSTLFIAEVTAMGKEKDMEPMVYFDRGYHRIDNEHNTFNSE